MPTTITGADTTTGALIPSSDTVPSNGVYLPAANSVGISTNSIQRVAVDANGNVAFDTNTLYVDAVNNRVSIGTTTASALLHIAGTATAGDVATRIQNESATDSAASATLEFVHGAGHSAGKIVSVRQGNYSSTAANQDSALAFHTALDGVNYERARLTSSGQWLVGTSSASGRSSLEVAGNIQQDIAIYSSAFKSWSTAAAAALFQVNMSVGNCGAELTYIMQDTAYPNGVRIGTVYIAVHGSGTTKSAVTLVQEAKASATSGTVSTITWSASIVSNEVQLTATPSTDSGTATVYLWGSSPFFTSAGIQAL